MSNCKRKKAQNGKYNNKKIAKIIFKDISRSLILFIHEIIYFYYYHVTVEIKINIMS